MKKNAKCPRCKKNPRQRFKTGSLASWCEACNREYRATHPTRDVNGTNLSDLACRPRSQK
jgi:hypothetical protein